MEHCAAATVAVQLSVPSLTVTFPVGVPAPDGTTLYCTVTAWPTKDGSGLSELIVVVVATAPTALTTCASPADALPRKFESTAKVAVNVRPPSVVSVSEHWPAATVPMQLSTPSLTVTFPVGDPAPGALTVTPYCTVTEPPWVDGSG